MEVFSENYKYKLKLIGYCMQMKKNEYIKVNLYINSHGQIYNISYIHTIQTKTNFLICEKGYNQTEIFQADFFGICNETLDLKRIRANEEELKENNIPCLSIIMDLFDKDAEIIATKYFSVDLKAEKLIIYPEKFQKVSSSTLLNKLMQVSGFY